MGCYIAREFSFEKLVWSDVGMRAIEEIDLREAFVKDKIVRWK